MVVQLPGLGKALSKMPFNPGGAQTALKLLPKPLVLSLDIDGTLIPWQGQPKYDELAVQRYSHTLNRPEIKDNSFIMLNTGRGLSAIQALIPILKKFPVDALGLNDGQQLFLHDRTLSGDTGTSAPDTEAWLRSLTPTQEDATWNAHLNGWSTPAVMQAASEELPKLGFEKHEVDSSETQAAMEGITQVFSKPIAEVPSADSPSSDSPRWVVNFYPDQAYMEITRSDHKPEREAIARFADQLGARLQQALLPQWPQAVHSTNVTATSTYVHLGPAGNSKGSLVHHLIEHRFAVPPQAVISAGDSFNDREILSANCFGDTPNYPVQVGKHPALSAYLEMHRPERLEQTQANQLDTGLLAQFEKLKKWLPFLAKQEPADAKNTETRNAEAGQAAEAGAPVNKVSLLA